MNFKGRIAVLVVEILRNQFIKILLKSEKGWLIKIG